MIIPGVIVADNELWSKQRVGNADVHSVANGDVRR